MNTPIRFEDACAVQSLLDGSRLSGACVAAGRLVILELGVPIETPPEMLGDLLEQKSGRIPEPVLRTLSSCVRRYPDGSLKMDLRFDSREDASKFLDIARASAACRAKVAEVRSFDS
jgi:hypothetical protein